MPNNSRDKIKKLIKDLLQEIITEDERVAIVNIQELELLPPNTFESYLKRNTNEDGTSIQYLEITREENIAANAANVKTPFVKNPFEMRYQSNEQVLNGGKMESINKLTVVKKVQTGNLLAYKSFTLTKPTQKPQSSKDGKQPKPEPIKVTLITSDSFTDKKGDPALLSEFLKKVNEEIGL
jgi:hypothetical protein